MDTKPANYSANATLTLCISDTDAGKRLDQVLAEHFPQYSRSRLQTWIRKGQVTLAGEVQQEPKKRLKGGEEIVLTPLADERLLADQPEAGALNIVYEDESLLVLNKPEGCVVHPGNGNWHGTLLNALLYYLPTLQQIPRAGIVHRLDKDTTGLMVVAKTLTAQTDLVRQLQARTVKRQYFALLQGVLEASGSVDAPIGRHPVQRTRMAVVRTGKPACTHYRVLAKGSNWTWVKCALETGRTHQISVHMAHIGHPLVGDPLYGKSGAHSSAEPAFHRQALHAFALALNHPRTGEVVHWQAPLPADLRALLTRLGLSEKDAVQTSGFTPSA